MSVIDLKSRIEARRTANSAARAMESHAKVESMVRLLVERIADDQATRAVFGKPTIFVEDGVDTSGLTTRTVRFRSAAAGLDDPSEASMDVDALIEQANRDMDIYVVSRATPGGGEVAAMVRGGETAGQRGFPARPVSGVGALMRDVEDEMRSFASELIAAREPPVPPMRP